MTRLLSHPPFAAFRKPRDISSPFPRLDFWLFYIGHVIASMAAAWSISALNSRLGQGVAATSLRMAGLALMLYLLVVLVTAICRRLVDSGYRRAALPVSALLWTSFLFLFGQDVAGAYADGARSIEAVDYATSTYAALLAAFLSTGYVAIGVMRPAAKPAQ